MLNISIGKTQVTCKPENLMNIQAKMAKPPKGGTKKSAEKRKFPNHSAALSSTDDYVREYLRINNLNFAGKTSEEWLLNTCSTTWPDSSDCTVEECEE